MVAGSGPGEAESAAEYAARREPGDYRQDQPIPPFCEVQGWVLLGGLARGPDVQVSGDSVCEVQGPPPSPAAGSGRPQPGAHADCQESTGVRRSLGTWGFEGASGSRYLNGVSDLPACVLRAWEQQRPAVGAALR